jgi:hypothetical protein
MKKLYVAFATLSILLLTGCGADVIKSSETRNPGVSGGVLAVVDGCTVYKLNDGDRNIYFVKCGGTTTTSWQSSCGKNCTETVEVPTFMEE